jgi:hypothetical protein
MALNTEQQFLMDLEATRHNNVLDIEITRAKLEAVRLAKEILVENARSKPVSERDVTAANIVTFAESIVNYIKT